MDNLIKMAADESAEPFREPYKKAWVILASMFGFLFVMWCINLLGGLGFNISLTIIGGSGIWYFGISPIMHVYTVGIGGIWSLISWKSPKAGISDSLHTLYSAVLLGFFIFLLSGIVLSTVYFVQNPMSFWALLLIVIGLLVASKIFDMKGKTITAFVVTASLLLFAASWILNISIAMPGSQDAKVSEWATEAKSWFSKEDTPATCPEEVLSVVIGTRLLVPKGCQVDVDTTTIRDGNYEYEFADQSLPLDKEGNRLLNGQTVQAYLTHSFFYPGRERMGMRFTTVNPNTFARAGIDAVEIVIQEKGANRKISPTLTLDLTNAQ